MTYLLDSQQKVWILFKFRFLNKSQSLDLFRNPNLDKIQTFPPVRLDFIVIPQN